MTAQERYEILLKDYVTPALKERHFTGSAGSYQLPNEKAFVQVGIQKDKWNTKDEVSFTINICVVDKSVWEGALKREPWMGPKPSPASIYPVEMWQNRLPMIPFMGRDKWWRVAVKSDLNATANDIVKRIDKHALPAITKQLDKIRQ